ncbi:O-antigen ligase family protein [Patescibacteria group bacterium]
MIKKIDNLITYSFYSLFLLIPFAVSSKTSELFEFNKMVLTYAIASLIISSWVIKMALSKQVIFKRTVLDIFLIILLLVQLASTLFSLDIRTSFFGYYSRFHGGLFSTITYIALFWAYVSNMNYKKTKRAIYFLFASTFLVCIWAILEHFGKSFSCLIFQDFGTFDVSCWVQDVQNRVFATFGQPNWLAAWIVGLIPLSWAMIIIQKAKGQNKNWKKLLWVFLSIIIFITLLYTKSRSGIVAFFVITVMFWAGISFLKIVEKAKQPNLLKNASLIILSLTFFAFTIGTPWTPNLDKILKKKTPAQNTQQTPTVRAPALEVGGTESSKIRKIVWEGAFNIWKNNPIFGTGVETFAYSYYKYRPLEHNLVSEWNFLYNKAHNEYLNIAGTTGTVGLLSYLALIGAVVYLFSKPLIKRDSKPDHKAQVLNLAFFLGYVSILITNFFGFSVVPVALQFFLLPAMAVSLTKEDGDHDEYDESFEKPTNTQLSVITIVVITLLFFLYLIGKYWYADTLYARGKLENDSGLFSQSRTTLLKAIDLSPSESVFWDELSSATSRLALIYAENEEEDTAKKIAISAANESMKATTLNSANVVIKKSQAQTFANLAVIDPVFLEKAKATLLETIKLAPTDAQLSYNLALIYYKTGEHDKFIDLLKKSVEMKPNYKKARFNMALYYIGQGDKESAKKEFRYILEKIGPDKNAQEELEKLENDSE